MSERPEVVVVDGLRETTEVLQAVFEPQGMTVCRQTSASAPAEADPQRPRVIVLHKDPTSDPAGPRVLVGRILTGSVACDADCRSLPLPFHYGDLIAAINAAVEAPAG